MGSTYSIYQFSFFRDDSIMEEERVKFYELIDEYKIEGEDYVSKLKSLNEWIYTISNNIYHHIEIFDRVKYNIIDQYINFITEEPLPEDVDIKLINKLTSFVNIFIVFVDLFQPTKDEMLITTFVKYITNIHLKYKFDSTHPMMKMLLDKFDNNSTIKNIMINTIVEYGNNYDFRDIPQRLQYQVLIKILHGDNYYKLIDKLVSFTSSDVSQVLYKYLKRGEHSHKRLGDINKNKIDYVINAIIKENNTDLIRDVIFRAMLVSKPEVGRDILKKCVSQFSRYTSPHEFMRKLVNGNSQLLKKYIFFLIDTINPNTRVAYFNNYDKRNRFIMTKERSLELVMKVNAIESDIM